MWKFILLILLFAGTARSQSGLIGKNEVVVNDNGILKRHIALNPLPNNNAVRFFNPDNSSQPLNPFNITSVKWSYTEPAAIGDYCKVSGNGEYNVTGWNLNNHRVSLYRNADATPVWEFPTNPNGFLNFVSISDTGSVIAAGSYHNIYLFNNTTNVPFFNYDLTRLSDTGIATSLDLTNNGQFLVCSVSRSDSSTIYGFNTSSPNPVWSKRIVPFVSVGGGGIQGMRISGNDSLVIINTYAEYFVFRTYTGQLVFRGLINPDSPGSGTQSAQGISGDGSVIATINYFGVLRVFQWNGTTYNFLWANQEPPGAFYNWYTTVDISNDGNNIAAGTLNFLSTSSYDGKIKVFRRSGSGTPVWTFSGCGDEVSAISFSKSGNILAASSWGEFNDNTEDLYIFKTFIGNTPIFRLNTPGSLFYCNTSNNGKVVVASGKAVHARQFGNGGLLYNIAVDTNDTPVSVNTVNSNIVGDYNLYQNFPNPFNPVTKIRFDILQNKGSGQEVKVIIYNALGKEVSTILNKNLGPGSYEVEFDGSDLSSGIYYYKLITADFSDTKKLILLK